MNLTAKKAAQCVACIVVFAYLCITILIGSKVSGTVDRIQNFLKYSNHKGDNGEPLMDNTEIADIFISVKTSGKNHANRVKAILQTWYMLAENQTYFFTDIEDKALQQALGGHIINTKCPPPHALGPLCCKTAAEFDTFSSYKKRWMCHVDDDAYVNVPQLVNVLNHYNHTKNWYLGKPTWKHPVEITQNKVKIEFWFATGMAYCVSRVLALKMIPHTSGGGLERIGRKIQVEDDLVIGFVIGHLLKTNLTVVNTFGNHFDQFGSIKPDELKNMATLGYKFPKNKQGKLNVVNVTGFSMQEDPTRFMSLHCHLFPHLKQCQKIQH